MPVASRRRIATHAGVQAAGLSFVLSVAGWFALRWVDIDVDVRVFAWVTGVAVTVAGLLTAFYVELSVGRRVSRVVEALNAHARQGSLERLPDLGEDEGDAPAQTDAAATRQDDPGSAAPLDAAAIGERLGDVHAPDRAAAELLDDGGEQLAVLGIETQVIDLQHRHGGGRDRACDVTVRLHLGIVAHAAQQAVGNARRAA